LDYVLKTRFFQHQIPCLKFTPKSDMDFTEACKLVVKALDSPLPGDDAQCIMAPLGRPRTDLMLQRYPDHRKSAVLLLIYPDATGLAHTVFMERAHDGSLHGGQISFPGGGIEQTDESPKHAAIREFEEELGLPASLIEIAGALTPLFIPASKFMVYPFIGMCTTPPTFNPDPYEVHAVIETPLHDLLSFQIEQGDFKTTYGTLKAPCYRLQKYLLWGATAMIVSEFREMVTGDL
jgi:8-oxo-dGTP pyrophosphatase MutT (NUDIX family)